MWYYHQPVSKLHLWFHVNAVCFVRSDAHLASHSRMSGSRWLITPSWLSGSLRSFLYGCVYSCHLFFIFSVSVRSIEFLSFRSIEFLSFIVPIFAWNVPLVSLVFLKRSLVFPILFSSVQSLGQVWLFATPWAASLCIINSWGLLTLISIQSVMPSNHLILYCHLLLLPSVFPSIRVFSDELVLCIRCPKYWIFSFSISPSNEYSGLISFRMD